jgi:hypothetical protein
VRDKNSSASGWAAYASTGFAKVVNVVNGANHTAESFRT